MSHRGRSLTRRIVGVLALIAGIYGMLGYSMVASLSRGDAGSRANGRIAAYVYIALVAVSVLVFVAVLISWARSRSSRESARAPGAV